MLNTTKRRQTLPANRFGIFIILFFMAFSSWAQPRLSRFDPYVDVGLGGAFRYGTTETFAQPGINLRSSFMFIELLGVELDGTYYIVNGNFEPNAFEVNLNARSNFYSDGRNWYAFGSAGINAISIKYDWGEEFGIDEPKLGIGFNLGGGIEYDLDVVRVFSELKTTTYNFDKPRVAAHFSVGVKYLFPFRF